MRAFKYFDLDGSGECSPDEFKKALEKIGITFSNEKELREIFTIYDINKNGELDYKEFSQIVFDKPSSNQNNISPSKVLATDGLL
jgi:Ca2+-binding EF-hand superfamily protein